MWAVPARVTTRLTRRAVAVAMSLTTSRRSSARSVVTGVSPRCVAVSHSLRRRLPPRLRARARNHAAAFPPRAPRARCLRARDPRVGLPRARIAGPQCDTMRDTGRSAPPRVALGKLVVGRVVAWWQRCIRAAVGGWSGRARQGRSAPVPCASDGPAPPHARLGRQVAAPGALVHTRTHARRHLIRSRCLLPSRQNPLNRRTHRPRRSSFLSTDRQHAKACRRRTQGTGRMRYMKAMPRLAKNGFRSGTQATSRKAQG